MAEARDARRHPRIRVRVPNSLRIRVKEGDCLADLLDISQSGVGVEFFDLFDVLIFSEGDVVKLEFLLKPEHVGEKTASDILKSIQKIKNEPKEEGEESEGSQEAFQVDAKIVWTYLNRLGLEFVGVD
ncbi:MAG: PilZ domain-containing protein [Pseudomonadota bacterium]